MQQADHEEPSQIRQWARRVYETLFEGLPDAMLLVDRAGEIHLANEQAGRVLGYEPQALLGKSVECLVPAKFRSLHPDLREVYFANPRVRAMASGRDLWAVRQDGTEFPSDISLAPVQSPFGPLACVALRDVSERVEARRGLERSRRALEEQVRERTQQLWNSNRLLTLDIKARLEAEAALNRQVCQAQALAALGERALRATVELVLDEAAGKVREVLGVDVVEVRERVLDDLRLHLRAAAGFSADVSEALPMEPRTSSPQAYGCGLTVPIAVDVLAEEKRFCSPEAFREDALVSLLIVPIPGEDDVYGVLLAGTREQRVFTDEEILFLQAVGHTLSAAVAQSRYRSRMLEQESLARIGAMASVVAHEVRNPLGGISGAVQLLRKNLPPDGEEEELTRMILDRIRVLDETIGDLLSFARPRSPLLAPINAKDMVRNAVELFSRDPAHEGITVSVSGADLEVEVDRDQIEAVLVNLLVNASQAMETEGPVAVRVRQAPGICRIEVADEGPGLPEELRQKVFEPFFTTKRRGTGLGLATSRRILETHGGALTASNGASGAVFTLTVPHVG